MRFRTVAVWEADLRARLREARRRADDQIEVCGLIVDVGPCVRLCPTQNVSRRKGSFQIGARSGRSIDRAAATISADVVGT